MDAILVFVGVNYIYVKYMGPSFYLNYISVEFTLSASVSLNEPLNWA